MTLMLRYIIFVRQMKLAACWFEKERLSVSSFFSVSCFLHFFYFDFRETPRIRISLCIRFWMVSEGLSRPYIADGWCQKTFQHHPKRFDASLDGVRRSSDTIHRLGMVSEGLSRPYIADGWCQKTFQHHPKRFDASLDGVRRSSDTIHRLGMVSDDFPKPSKI